MRLRTVFIGLLSVGGSTLGLGAAIAQDSAKMPFDCDIVFNASACDSAPGEAIVVPSGGEAPACDSVLLNGVCLTGSSSGATASSGGSSSGVGSSSGGTSSGSSSGSTSSSSSSGSSIPDGCTLTQVIANACPSASSSSGGSSSGSSSSSSGSSSSGSSSSSSGGSSSGGAADVGALGNSDFVEDTTGFCDGTPGNTTCDPNTYLHLYERSGNMDIVIPRSKILSFPFRTIASSTARGVFNYASADRATGYSFRFWYSTAPGAEPTTPFEVQVGAPGASTATVWPGCDVTNIPEGSYPWTQAGFGLSEPIPDFNSVSPFTCPLPATAELLYLNFAQVCTDSNVCTLGSLLGRSYFLEVNIR